MATSTFEILEDKKVKLTITVPADDFNAAIQKAYLKVKKDVMLPGFRKGKVPRPMIEKYYGAEIFFEDAFEIVFPESYMEAIKEHKIEDVDRPDVDVDQIEKGKDLIYTATVTVKPEVTLGKYQGTTVEVFKKKVTDADVDAEIKQEADKIARLVDVEGRVAANDDTANIDYVGSVDGVEFEGGKGEGYDLALGSNTFIPGFEEQVVGMNIGDEKDVKVTFPEEYHSDDLKGKDAVFKVKLNSLKAKELPEIDDEFAKDVSEFDTLDEYKKSIKEKQEKQAENDFESAKENAVVEKLVEVMEADIPDCMVENQTNNTIRELEYSFQNQGFPLDQYLQMTGMTMDNLREQYKEQSLTSVKSQLALEAVTKAEGFEVSDEELEAEFESMAKERDTDVEKIKKVYAGENIEYLKESILVKKTLEFVKEQIKVKETNKAPKA